MNYHVRFQAGGWAGRNGNEWTRKYMFYSGPRSVIAEIKAHYRWPEDDWAFPATGITIYEDRGGCDLRLVCDKPRGRRNFAWAK